MSEIAGSTAQSFIDAQPILVATDFSCDSEAALLWAGRYAALSGATLHVLHVIHDPADAAGFYLRHAKNPEKTMSDVAEEMMATFLGKMRDEYAELAPIKDARSELVSGLPPGRIVEVAKREGAQMIVIGSRGRTGLSSILLGSVAERVAQLAPMPVVIVKGQEDG